MHPILFTIGPFTFYSYGLMFVIAFVTGTLLARRAARQLPPHLVAVPADQVLDLITSLLLGGIIGARVFFVILEWRSFLSAPFEVFALWHGGLVWYGGFFGSLLAGWRYTRSRRISFLRMVDQIVPFLALGHAIGRIGCFLNGCCYGRPTTSWCGVQFPELPGPVLPTQLFEAAGLFLLYRVLRLLQRPAVLARSGLLFGYYLVGYSGLRFVIEFVRGDQSVWWMGLTLQQGISIGMFFVGLLLCKRARQRGRAPRHRA